MLNERKLTKAELNKREDIVKDMKKNKRALVKRYGKDAEKVMYGRATNIAKKQSENMNQDKLREMIKDALKNPKKADLNKDGKLSDYEKKRGAAIEKNMEKVDEMDINDPVMMKMRAANAGGDPNDKFFEKNAARLSKLKALKDKRAKIIRDMEQEAEMEGGPIADRYGDMLNKIDKAIDMLRTPEEKEYALKEGIPTDLEPLAFNILYSSLRNKYITIEEATDESVIGVAREVAEDHADDEEIGSSDMTFIVKEFLDGIGKKTGFENGRLVVSKDEESKSVNEGIWPKSKLSDRFEFILSDELKKNFKGIFYVVGYDLYHNDKKVMTINSDKDSVNSIVKTLKSKLKESVKEDLDLGHQDNEPGMLKGDLYKIGKYSMELYQMMDNLENMGGEVDFPHWWQSKIITAKNMISGAKHYLEFELKEPQIDAMVDVADEEGAIGESQIKAENKGDSLKKASVAKEIASRLAEKLKSK